MHHEEVISIWPRKSGYLRKQINSVLDIWNTRYFYLDGTNLLYFIDETEDKPRETIDLRGCLIDGVWLYDSLWTFTIRSLTDENLFYYLGAFSESDAEEWIQNLKNSIVLKELELISNKLIEESELADFHSELITEHDRNNPMTNHMAYMDEFVMTKPSNEEYFVPHHVSKKPEAVEQAFEEFKHILKDKSIQWAFLKQDTCMKIYAAHLQNNRKVYRASIVLEGDLPSFTRIFEHHINTDLWNINVEDISLVSRIDELGEIYKETYQFTKNAKTFNFTDKFIKFKWMEADKLFMIKTSLEKSIKYDQRPNKSDGNSIDLNIITEAIKIESYELTGNPKCALTAVIIAPVEDLIKHPIIEKFFCQYLINFTILKWEYHEILEKIWERSISWANSSKSAELSYPQTTNEQADSFQDRGGFASPSQKENPSFSGKSPMGKSLTQKSEAKQGEFSKDKQQDELETPDITLFKQFSGFANLDQPVKYSKPLDRRAVLNENQVKVYVEFKRKYAQINDNMLNAEEALIKYMNWYREYNVEKMSYGDFKKYDQKYWKVPGRDKEGRPVCIIRCCRYFPDQIDFEEFKAFFLTIIEMLLRSLPDNVDQYVWVMDTENVSYRNVSIDSLRWQIDVTQNNFPERMRSVYILYSNWMIKGVWNTVKFFVPEKSRYKFKFVGEDKKEIYTSLLDILEDDRIPEKYGGSLKVLDPYD